MLRLSYLNTMRGLEDGLRVADIAVFDLETCTEDERIRDVLARVGRFDFDNVPVRRDASIVSVVEDITGYRPETQVAAVATQLSEEMLVAGSMSLRNYLPAIATRPYRLVVGDSGISGVVTPSDVVQLPVRLLVFALVAHLEEVMRAVIRQEQPDDEQAVRLLTAERLKNVRKTLRRQKSKGINPAPLDVTQFIDKAHILFELDVIDARPGDWTLFEEFYDLRNRVDHVDRYAETPAKLAAFLEHVRQLETWIDRLTALLPPDAPAVQIDRRRAR